MKKLFSLLLTGLLLLPVFTACGESQENSDPAADSNQTAANENPTAETAAPEETALSDDLPDADFGGYEFRIASGMGEGIPMANRITVEDYTGTPVTDALRDSTVYIEDRFNVKLNTLIYDNDKTAYTSAVTAGDDAYDIQVAADYVSYGMAASGMFIDMFSVEQFNFDKPWWPKRMTETLSICGSLYTTSSYLSYMGLDWTRALLINKDYAERQGLTVPYDKVREGTWTLDSMIAYVEGVSNDLDGNGKIDKQDEIGFVTGSQTWYCLQESMDIPVYRKDAEGNLILDFDIDRVDTYVTKMRALMNTPDFLQTSDFFGVEMFKPGKALLCYGQIGDAYSSYREVDFKYGFLPTPKFDEAQAEYINCCTDGPWAIPITVPADHMDVVGTICEGLSCRNYQYVLPSYFETSMKSRLADSPDDAEMLQLIADTRTTSFSYANDLTFKNILSDLGNNDKGVASYYEKSSKAANKLLEKLVSSYESLKDGN